MNLEQKVREVLGLCAYTAPRNREIIDQSVTAIMEEVGKEGCDCNNCMSECKEIVGLRAEVSHLKAHQADCDEAYKTVMDERCSANEVHCTCVPFLRVGIAQLKAEIKRLKGCEKDSCKCIKCGVTMVEYQKYHELCPICFVETTQQ